MQTAISQRSSVSNADDVDDELPRLLSFNLTIPFILPSGTATLPKSIKCDCSPRPNQSVPPHPEGQLRAGDLLCQCSPTSGPGILPHDHKGISASDVETAIGTAWNIAGAGGILLCGAHLLNQATGKYFDVLGQLDETIVLLSDTMDQLKAASRLPEMILYFPAFIRTCSSTLTTVTFELQSQHMKARKRGKFTIIASSLSSEIAEVRRYVRDTREHLYRWFDNIENSSNYAKQLHQCGRPPGTLTEKEQLDFATALQPRQEVNEGSLFQVRGWFFSAGTGNPHRDLEANAGVGTSDEEAGGINSLSRAPGRTSNDGGDPDPGHIAAARRDRGSSILTSSGSTETFDYWHGAPGDARAGASSTACELVANLGQTFSIQILPQNSTGFDYAAMNPPETLNDFLSQCLLANPWLETGEAAEGAVAEN